MSRSRKNALDPHVKRGAQVLSGGTLGLVPPIPRRVERAEASESVSLDRSGGAEDGFARSVDSSVPVTEGSGAAAVYFAKGPEQSTAILERSGATPACSAAPPDRSRRAPDFSGGFQGRSGALLEQSMEAADNSGSAAD
jgi:hypothetical protein